MRVLVTGGAGFIGRRVVLRLEERGHEARVLDRALDAVDDVTDLGRVREVLAGCDAVAHLESGTRQAESGVEQLREAAENAGRQLARQVERAAALQDDLGFLHARGEGLADRLEAAIRAGRGLAAPPAGAEPAAPAEAGPRVRSQAERDLLRALKVAR